MIDWDAFYAAFRDPDFIPGYEIQNHLGGGAFGEVYRARKRSIGKPYAIKFVRLEAGHGEAEEELEQVRLFASIDHPHLVTIEDMGVVLGVPYLIMGYAGEDTLARRLARGELDPERAVRFFVQACRGVLALHDRRLAHFDLKPSNVFLRGDIARVGDYGLAKLLVDGGATTSGGTPRYMAPEMAAGHPDHRADIYSLGLILYESLLGGLPADVESAPRDAAPQFPKDFPPRLRSVIQRCLRIDPEERYPSLHALLDELGQTARQGDSIRVRYGSLSEELKELQRRSPGSHGPALEETLEDALEREDGNDAPAEVTGPGFVAAATDSGQHPGEDESLDERGSRSRRRRHVRPESEASPAAAPTDSESDADGDPSPGGSLRAVPRPSGPAAGEDDVVSAHSLTGPAESAPGPNAEALRRATETTVFHASDPNAPWRRELDRARRIRSGEAREEDFEDPAEAARDQAPADLLPAVRPPTGPGTIPVPPRASGGWFGNVTQSVIVGGEIMGALVTGPILVAVRSTASTIDRLLRGFPGVLGSSLRFLLVMIVLALLGAGVSLVVLAALALKA